MKHTIETGLDKAISKKALEKAMASYQERFAEYSPHFGWVSDDRGEFGFNAKGVKLKGEVVVREGQIDVDMQVPFLFRVFQGKAMKVVTDAVNGWVEKAKRGEI